MLSLRDPGRRIASLFMIAAAAAVMLAVLFFADTGRAYALTEGDWEYEEIEGEDGVRIIKYNGTATTVTVPSTLGGKTVTELNNTETNKGTFYSNSTATKITVPNTVTKLGVTEFYNASKLTEVVLPDTITEIGRSCFMRCPKLTKINIPASLKVIPQSFLQQDSTITLSSLTIPEGVEEIGQSAFYNVKVSNGTVTVPHSCHTIRGSAFQSAEFDKLIVPGEITTLEPGSIAGKIKTIEFDGELQNYAKNGKFILTADGKQVIGVEYDTLRQPVARIPSGVESITNSVVRSMNAFKLVVPGSITEVTSQNLSFTSFYGIEFEEGFTTLGGYNIYQSSSIETLTLPSTISSIANYAINGCSKLKDVTILSSSAPSTTGWTSYGQPSTSITFHVPAGATGYTASPWTNYTIKYDAELMVYKNGLKDELCAYKGLEEYGTSERTQVINAITAGRTAINNAADEQEADAALADAKAAIDRIRTLEQQTKIKVSLNENRYVDGEILDTYYTASNVQWRNVNITLESEDASIEKPNYLYIKMINCDAFTVNIGGYQSSGNPAGTLFSETEAGSRIYTLQTGSSYGILDSSGDATGRGPDTVQKYLYVAVKNGSSVIERYRLNITRKGTGGIKYNLNYRSNPGTWSWNTNKYFYRMNRIYIQNTIKVYDANGTDVTLGVQINESMLPEGVTLEGTNIVTRRAGEYVIYVDVAYLDENGEVAVETLPTYSIARYNSVSSRKVMDDAAAILEQYEGADPDFFKDPEGAVAILQSLDEHRDDFLQVLDNWAVESWDGPWGEDSWDGYAAADCTLIEAPEGTSGHGDTYAVTKDNKYIIDMYDEYDGDAEPTRDEYGRIMMVSELWAGDLNTIWDETEQAAAIETLTVEEYKEKKKGELEALAEEKKADYREAEQAEIDTLVEEQEALIDAAETLQDVKDAFGDAAGALDAMDLISDAEYTELEKVEAAAAERADADEAALEPIAEAFSSHMIAYAMEEDDDEKVAAYEKALEDALLAQEAVALAKEKSDAEVALADSVMDSLESDKAVARGNELKVAAAEAALSIDEWAAYMEAEIGNIRAELETTKFNRGKNNLDRAAEDAIAYDRAKQEFETLYDGAEDAYDLAEVYCETPGEQAVEAAEAARQAAEDAKAQADAAKELADAYAADADKALETAATQAQEEQAGEDIAHAEAKAEEAAANVEKAEALLAKAEELKARAVREKEAKELLDSQKEEAIEELENYKADTAYREAEARARRKEVLIGIEDIRNAESKEEIDAALAAAKAEIDKIKTEEDLSGEETALAEAKRDAKAALDGYDPEDFIEADREALHGIVSGAKEEIDACGDPEAVAQVLAEAEDAIDGLMTQEEQLAKLKEFARGLLDEVDPDNYIEEDRERVAALVAAAEAAIDRAETPQEVAQAVQGAALDLEDCTTIEEQEQADAEALEEAKEEAVRDVFDLFEEYAETFEDSSELAKLAIAAVADIQNAADPAEAGEILNGFRQTAGEMAEAEAERKAQEEKEKAERQDIDEVTPSAKNANEAAVDSVLDLEEKRFTAACAVSAGTITLKWPYRKGVDNYKVAYRLAGAAKWTEDWAGGWHGYILKGAKKGAAYDIRVRAFKKVNGVWIKGNWTQEKHVFVARGKVKTLKPGKKKLTVKAVKVSGATQYLFRYSLKKNMKGAKKLTAAKNSCVIKKLKSKKKYFVTVLPKKVISGKTYTGVVSPKKASKKVK